MSQPKYSDVYSAAKTYTYSPIASAAAIKGSTPTATTPQTYVSADFSGGIESGQRSAARLPFEQAITATTSSHTGSYKTGAANPIVVTGTGEDGSVVTDTILLTAANGGETVSTTKGFATVTSIAVPGQNDTAGAFTFGIGDIALAKPVRQVRAGADGNIKVGYPGGIIDTLTLVATEKEQVLPTRIYSDPAATTAVPIRVYA